jgi:GNAT superfamily N-acetyltransferase
LDSSPPDLARQVEEAQSLLDTPAAAQARRLERAFATTCRSIAAAMARLDPTCGAGSLDLPAGVAVFAGSGSPLTQALALGTGGPVTAADLDRIEAFLVPGGSGAPQVELGPFAHPTAAALLAARGYRIVEWQLAWTRVAPVGTAGRPDPAPPGLEVRRVRRGEEDTCLRATLSGFLEADEVPDDALALMRPGAYAGGHELWMALVDGEPAGGGTLSWADGIAFVNGCGVRPRLRRRGAQGALIRARLDRARELGCDVIASTTLPGTPSRRNMERHGFQVAYPKLVLVGPPRGG